MNELLSDLDLDEPVESRPSKTQRIEQAIVMMANSVWAVVGLVLWLPQIVRVVITSAFRLVHAALTSQPIEGIRGPIRQVSRFYIDGFLTLGADSEPKGYGRRQLQLGRFLVEAIWVVAVWLLVLRFASPPTFLAISDKLLAFGLWSWHRAVDGAQWVIERLPATLRALADLGTVGAVTLVALLIVFFVGGFVLGRRR